jgi:hypothetical protein
VTHATRPRRLSLLALAPRAEAQFQVDIFKGDVPDGYYAPINGPNDGPPVGDCGIAVPAA